MFRKYKKGIKVCHVDFCERFASAFAVTGRMKYEIGKWTRNKRGCGPLAVFDNLVNAINFFRKYDTLRTRIFAFFECQYKKSRKKTMYVKYPDGAVGTYPLPLPKGTILADKVKLIKEIEIKCKRLNYQT